MSRTARELAATTLVAPDSPPIVIPLWRKLTNTYPRDVRVVRKCNKLKVRTLALNWVNYVYNDLTPMSSIGDNLAEPPIGRRYQSRETYKVQFPRFKNLNHRYLELPSGLQSNEFSNTITSTTRTNTMAFQQAPKPGSLLEFYWVLSPNASVRVSPLCLGAMNFGDAWKGFMGRTIYRDENASFLVRPSGSLCAWWAME